MSVNPHDEESSTLFKNVVHTVITWQQKETHRDRDFHDFYVRSWRIRRPQSSCPNHNFIKNNIHDRINDDPLISTSKSRQRNHDATIKWRQITTSLLSTIKINDASKKNVQPTMIHWTKNYQDLTVRYAVKTYFCVWLKSEQNLFLSLFMMNFLHQYKILWHANEKKNST